MYPLTYFAHKCPHILNVGIGSQIYINTPVYIHKFIIVYIY